MKSKFIFSIIIILFYSCNNSKWKIVTTVQEWQGKKIFLPVNLPLKVQGRDTISTNYLKSRYKIFNYIDTNGCTACKARLHEWQLFQRQIDSLQLNVSFIFIAQVKNYTALENLLQINNCYIPCIYDTNGNIAKLNNFPAIPNLQTFLVDSLNQVKIIGNPIENKKIHELYLKQLQQ